MLAQWVLFIHRFGTHRVNPLRVPNLRVTEVLLDTTGTLRLWGAPERSFGFSLHSWARGKWEAENRLLGKAGKGMLLLTRGTKCARWRFNLHLQLILSRWNMGWGLEKKTQKRQSWTCCRWDYSLAVQRTGRLGLISGGRGNSKHFLIQLIARISGSQIPNQKLVKYWIAC